MKGAWTHNDDCPKCGGKGWLWWYDLIEYSEPANDDLIEYSGPANETGQDDNRYACDHECHRKEIPDGLLATIGKEVRV